MPLPKVCYSTVNKRIYCPSFLQKSWFQVLWYEVTAAGKEDIAAQKLPDVPWVKRIKVTKTAPEITAWNLGAGESEVLSFALANPGYRAMVDDATARHCAQSLGISIFGTGGALVLAKRRGLIPSVSEAV